MFLLRSLCFLPLCLAGALLPALSQSTQPIVVPLLHSRTVLPIVFARINGKGPYKFILDTGTNITLIDSSLFRELNLEERGTTSESLVSGMALGKLGSAREISIGGLSQREVQVLEVNGIKRPDLGPTIRGVLGENFLCAFDVLIDNQHRQISFDTGDTLILSLAGEHLPLTSSSQVHGIEVKDRPLVWASIPSFDNVHLLHLLLDTGSESLTLAPGEASKVRDLPAAYVPLRKFTTNNEGSPCALWKGHLRLGETTTRPIKIKSCTSPGAPDDDGTLPTFLFKRVFISHVHGFLILDPVDVGSSGQGSRR